MNKFGTSDKKESANKSSSKLEARDFENVTKLHCSVACMGKWCKHENFKNCANPAIAGLHSEWVLDLMIGS